MKEIFMRMYNNDEENLESSVHDELTKDCDLVELATKFTDQLPENTFSPANVQGYLLTKKYPQDAVKDVGRWRDEQVAKA
jgi:mitochondrial chaperone BCS1